jgi:Flp pilus assembly protein TadG
MKTTWVAIAERVKCARSFAGRFLRDKAGNTAMIAALSATALVGVGGAGVDMSRAMVARNRVSEALDAAALAVGTQTGLSTSQIQTMAQQYFNANYSSSMDASYGTPGPVNATVTGTNISLSVSASVPTTLLQIVGTPDVNFTVNNTVTRSTTRLRVALVLDNTGSMADSGKLTALQAAATNLLTQLSNAASTNGDVYVSIVPFAKDVNVGSSNYQQSWVKFSGESDTFDENNGSNQQSCSGSGRHQTCTTTWVPANHNTWNGCVMDRDQNYDENNTTPSVSNSSTLFPAEQYNACPEQLMSLSYNWTTLKAEITNMVASGGTNQAVGLAWGYQSLTASPFTIPTEDPTKQYSHIIILLSDGLNTQDRWYGDGSTHSQSVDNREAALCTNIKNAGFTIYTVQVNTDNEATSTVLQNCASDSTKFFLLTSSSQVVTTFNVIGTQLANLHLSN